MDIRLHTRTPPTPGNGPEAAAYIASVAAQLSELAKSQGFATLAYILDMARLEAELKTDPRAR